MSTNIREWTEGVPVEWQARQQLFNIAKLPIIAGHVAVMPDVHLGKGATVGSVIPTQGAIIPAAVGVDIGCGMIAMKTDILARELPVSLATLRSAIESEVPVGFNFHDTPLGGSRTTQLWTRFDGLAMYEQGHLGGLNLPRAARQLGSLGGGNHFIELCLDENDGVWIMLHSGSRNIGKTMADVAIGWARDRMQERGVKLPDADLAWLSEGDPQFDAYIEALRWAQDYAMLNRDLMMGLVRQSVSAHVRPFDQLGEAINCHHNYASLEEHFGREVWVTRKGAVSARDGELGVIPGSMGSRSYIVSGKGNADSYCSCSHGAGRRMSRGEAKRTYTVADVEQQTAGVECRKDTGIIDEIPGAYKDIDTVMAAQADLVSTVATLKQVMCIKG